MTDTSDWSGTNLVRSRSFMASEPSPRSRKAPPSGRVKAAPKPAPAEKVVRPTLGNEVYLRLRAMIERGDLKAGDPVPSERDLAIRFGVGRASIREAVLMLAGSGLITVIYGCRPEVADITLVSVLDQVELPMQLMALSLPGATQNLNKARLTFERLAARDAAMFASGDDVARLRECLDQQRDAEGTSAQSRLADLAFHRQIVGSMRNPIASAVFDALLNLLQPARPAGQGTDACQMSCIHEHEGIVEAIASGDPDMAEALISSNLKRELAQSEGSPSQDW